jgi:hypothetical protein
VSLCSPSLRGGVQSIAEGRHFGKKETRKRIRTGNQIRILDKCFMKQVLFFFYKCKGIFRAEIINLNLSVSSICILTNLFVL